MLVGTTAYIDNWNGSQKLIVSGSGNAGIGIATGNSVGVVAFGRSGDSTPGSNALVTSGDIVGVINFAAGDGLTRISVARVSAEVAGVASAGVVPGALTFSTSATSGVLEAARIDPNGRFLLNVSSALSDVYVDNTQITPILQVEGNSGATSAVCITRRTGAASNLILQRGVIGTPVAINNVLGQVNFNGLSDTNFRTAAQVTGEADGIPSASNMPGRLVFSTTPAGAVSSTERMRICEDGTLCYNQAAPAAVNSTATLTVDNLKKGIITSTTAAAVTMTLPTGTLTQGGFNGIYNNFTFEWSVINTGATNAVTIAAGSAHTLVGSGTIAAGTSGKFASRRTGNNTFVAYRLS
jgi:hypothetical protein